MDPQPIDLNRVIAGMAALLHSTIGATILIEMQPASGLWAALADAAQIELVLLNLAINARDAMPMAARSQYHLQRDAGRAAAAGRTAGPGIMSSVRSRHRHRHAADVSTRCSTRSSRRRKSARAPGSGWPGPRFRQAVGRRGPDRTAAGRGHSVTSAFRVPKFRADRPAAGGRRGLGAASPGGDPAGRRRPSVREVAAAMLRDLGYEVEEAGSGGAALDLLTARQVRPDARRFAMPGMSGADLVRQARSRPQLPALYVTGFADRTALAGVGESEIVGKPFHMEELARKVRSVLAKSTRRACA